MTGDEGRSTRLFPLEEMVLQSRGKAVTCEGIESASDIAVVRMLPFRSVFFRGRLLNADVCK